MFGEWEARWNVPKSDIGFAAARRLFRDWDEMQTFFQLAFPGSIAIGGHRYIVDTKLFGNAAIDGHLVLTTLAEASVERHELTPAAFLVADNDNCVVYGVPLITCEQDTPRAREFLTAFADTPIEDLRTVFAREPWANTGVVRWVKDCLTLRVPAAYVETLISAPSGRFYLEAWSPQAVADLYAQGAPAAYLAHFWEYPDKFDEAWSNGLSYEYATVL